MYAALRDPAAMDEAGRQVIEEIPTSTTEQFETLLAVLIERYEQLGRPGVAGTLWDHLIQTINDHPPDLTAGPVGGDQRPAPDDLELDLIVLEGNSEVDVVVALPTRRALAFFTQVSGGATRPDAQRQAAAVCLRHLSG